MYTARICFQTHSFSIHPCHHALEREEFRYSSRPVRISSQTKDLKSLHHGLQDILEIVQGIQIFFKTGEDKLSDQRSQEPISWITRHPRNLQGIYQKSTRNLLEIYQKSSRNLQDQISQEPTSWITRHPRNRLSCTYTAKSLHQLGSVELSFSV